MNPSPVQPSASVCSTASSMADRTKKSKLDDHVTSDPPDSELVLSIQKLQEVQDELEKVNEEASEKVLEVEQKYNEIRKPIYQKRTDIIHGIPDFWLTAFLSHPALSEILTDDDQQVFKFLQSLDVEDFKDVKSGYSITFTFQPNPYFEDTKLVKVFRFSDEGTTSISGTQPRWKDGMDFTNGRNHTIGMKRPPPEESFFKWFTDTEQKDSSEGIHDEIADIIREDLWPNPLKYFNNDQDDDDDDDEDDDDDDGFDEGAEDDEGGDEADDDDDDDDGDDNDE
ncbi:hypothetical protein KP509_23G082800 [Ceratopteris richardii]|uniref:Uncharacterized protein n=1 Tax=Ceratopteris richardii TaxID=49495 RepID=A0A8T2S3S1_CERRI|nr:hypothetical protein KP509_23G082800 [Ceratopteris richardii]